MVEADDRQTTIVQLQHLHQVLANGIDTSDDHMPFEARVCCESIKRLADVMHSPSKRHDDGKEGRWIRFGKDGTAGCNERFGKAIGALEKILVAGCGIAFGQQPGTHSYLTCALAESTAEFVDEQRDAEENDGTGKQNHATNGERPPPCGWRAFARPHGQEEEAISYVSRTSSVLKVVY